MIKRKLLYQDHRNNCAFVGYDRKNVVRYISIKGTYTKGPQMFTGEADGSKKTYGWAVSPFEPCALLRVFESAIDAMSFMTIEKMNGNDWHNAHYLSIGGLVPSPIIHFLRTYKEIETVEFCFDNDPAAQKFIQNFSRQFADKSITWNPRIPTAKDWNEQLQLLLQSAESLKGD